MVITETITHPSLIGTYDGEISLAITGTAPITVTWYKEDGSYLSIGTSISNLKSGIYRYNVRDGVATNYKGFFELKAINQTFTLNGTLPNSDLEYVDSFKEDSYTISYQPATKHWVSFHSYLPGRLSQFTTGIYAFNFQNILELNKGNRGNYSLEEEPQIESSLIDIISAFGDNIQLHNVYWFTDSFKKNKEYQLDDSFDYITIWNFYQCTGRINLVNRTTGTMIEGSKWSYNEVVDRYKPIFSHIRDGYLFVTVEGLKPLDKPIITSPFTITRLEYSNENGNALYLNNFETNVIKSQR